MRTKRNHYGVHFLDRHHNILGDMSLRDAGTGMAFVLAVVTGLGIFSVVLSVGLENFAKMIGG